MSKRIKEIIVRYDDKQSFIYGNTLGEVVGELVRCKDCKYAEVYDGYYTQVCCENGVIGGHGELWNPDDFCSYGECKESE